MPDAVIVSAARTAVGKAPRGTLRETAPEALATSAVREALARVPALDPAEVEDLILGCAMPEGAQGLNIARHVGLAAGLPVTASAMTVNRFCASGLQALALASQSIASGATEIAIAGGLESMSAVPMIGFHFAPGPEIAEGYPQVFLNMGLTAEEVARRFDVSRAAQDAWALRSHQRAAAAVAEGRFREQIAPVEALETRVDRAGRPSVGRRLFIEDEGVRRDTDAAALAKLRPVFAEEGTVTAGNSSQMSDGAAALVVMSADRAASLGLQPLGRLVAFATAGVPPEIMGIGPVAAVPKALRKAGLALDDLAAIELNEAFAAQVVAVVRQLGLDEERVNPDGGAIALGHPLGATGAKLSVQLLDGLGRRGARYGMVTMCVGGGQGAAGIIEWLGGRMRRSEAARAAVREAGLEPEDERSGDADDVPDAAAA